MLNTVPEVSTLLAELSKVSENDPVTVERGGTDGGDEVNPVIVKVSSNVIGVAAAEVAKTAEINAAAATMAIDFMSTLENGKRYPTLVGLAKTRNGSSRATMPRDASKL